MGALQFMPSSYRRYAVSDASTRPRAICGTTGATSSRASPTTCTSTAGSRRAGAGRGQLGRSRRTSTPPEHLALNETLGACAPAASTSTRRCRTTRRRCCSARQQQDGLGYRVGFHNFYVITRYNSSPLYAMAVHDLAQAIAQQHRAGGRALSTRACCAPRWPPLAGLPLRCCCWPAAPRAPRTAPRRPRAAARAASRRRPSPAHPRCRCRAIEPRSAYGNPPFYEVAGHRYIVLRQRRGLRRARRGLLVRPGLSWLQHLERRAATTCSP